MKDFKRKFITIWILIFACVGFWHVIKPLPEGVASERGAHAIPAEDIIFLSDITYMSDEGERVSQQKIFDEVFTMIDDAQEFILIDMFLFNNFLGSASESYRSLSGELASKLSQKKQQNAEIQIVVITDPINTVYGGDTSEAMSTLQESGINLIYTDLEKLRDSNPFYSSVWRVLGNWWGNSEEGGVLPHIMDARRDKITLRTYLRLLNFKANHRKVIVSDYRGDDGKSFASLITSANPHDGSSAHSNIAVRINSKIWEDVIDSEYETALWSGGSFDTPASEQEIKDREAGEEGPTQVKLITEGEIKKSLLKEIGEAEEGDKIDMAMFYISDRDIVKALKNADTRGVELRLLFDPNKDAFGREKNGIPNRQVAHELAENSNGNTEIRWCNTHGEQCHSKITLIQREELSVAILGSANLTRRNIGDYNLETNVMITSPESSGAIKDMQNFFENQWSNDSGREYSLPYESFADSSKWKYYLYRYMEATGMSSF